MKTRTAAIGLIVLLAVPGIVAQEPPPATAAPAPVNPPQGQSVIIQRVLVKVNGEIFTQTDLVEAQIAALKEKKLPVTRAQDLQDDARLKAALIEVTPDILLEVDDNLLLIQSGRELTYKLSDERFKEFYENVKKENKLDDAGLKAALAQEGMTVESWRAQMNEQYIRSQVERNEIMQRAALTDEEARQYYQKHPQEFMTAATVTLREITILVPTQPGQPAGTVSVGAAETAKEKAAAVRERAVKGEDFAKLAAEVSESGSKANGGLLGTIVLDEMDPTLRTTIEALKAGEVSEPVRTSAGYTLFKLDAKSTPELKPFNAVRDDISQKVYTERVGVETEKYLVKLRAQAFIEWKDDILKKQYETALAKKAAG
jgi:parvulin-like peptidyl-prolyl isomerase